MPTAESAVNYLDEKGRHKGIGAWIFSTDHKRIGLLYLMSALSFFFVGVILGFVMRLELLGPDTGIVSARTYNSLFTFHGVIQIFFFIIPGLAAPFGNFFLPIMIGAKDVAFPRINLLSWWLFISGAVVILVSLFTGGGPIDTGWTFYVPYSVTTGANVQLAVFGVFLVGFSSILTGVNFVTTIHRLRAPGMTFFRMPLFVWSLYATAWVQIVATPIIGITMLLVMIERIFGIGIFDPSRGGDPILFQHLFWIYSHPAVYIMILPAMGAVTEIFPVFARKTIFGYTAVAFSSLAIALVGYLVWGHHMFVAGMSDTARWVFSLFTFLVAIPSGVKVLNWTATLYKGSIEPAPPLLFALAFIVLFSIGGLTGLIQGALSVNAYVHDTYWVVGHFHYVMFGGTGFAFFAALHYWFPKMFGKMYSRRVASLAWVIVFTGFNLLYFPMLVLGMEGMPRRYYHYLPRFQTPNEISTIGSWVLILGLVVMFANLLKSLVDGRKAEKNPWGGLTLEWQVPSPPPRENFDVIPRIERGPYDYGKAVGQ